MSYGINGLLNMGQGALNTSQSAIQVTGNNISNVNTVGYSRQTLDIREAMPLNGRPGQIGQGVYGKEVYRHFDKFIESAFLDKSTLQRRYEEQYNLLRSVENLFNESHVSGVGDALTDMFKAFAQLAQEPDSHPARAALIAKVNTLTGAIRNVDASLASMQEQVDVMIREEVDRANGLIKEIAELNREIYLNYMQGRNNPNSLMDARDQKVRDLSNILDVSVEDRGPTEYMLTTGNGMLLVQHDIPFSLQYGTAQVENNLSLNSPYDGTAGFSGIDGYEYTVEIVNGGTIDTTGSPTPPAGTAQYRVSLDGGRTWLKDSNGNDQLFYATDQAHSSHVKDLDIYFNGTTNLQTGDRFLLTPKSDVYWVSPTSGPIDISTQVFGDGTDNNQRITGGTLGGFLEFRDRRIGEYRDQLASFTDSLIWEVNRVHSQGAGLVPLTGALGTYSVDHTDIPLGSRSTGLHYFERLQEGNVSFAIYDTTTGKPVIGYPGIEVFSPTNFDPATHSLEDVRDAINNGPANTYMTATIIDNRLQLESKPGFSFAITSDTCGLAAALGINTFFSGESPGSIGLREDLNDDLNLINAGRVNGAGEVNHGDNLTASELADLVNKRFDIATSYNKHTNQTFSGFYATMVAKIGSDTASVKFTAATEKAMAQELHNRREEISGVNLDEEMSNLIKFQASYKAAAKLITTADQMLQTLLSLKQ